ncbi:MAG TPA: tripartite tricarboxylate transporter substrate-binding protein, partial [Burkholderiales bacterium]|nr:tripartite tricarboxylate transporter substrate-binding protein [Burkholderiales bacterium]
PKPIVTKLNDALVKTLHDPKIAKALIERGAQPIGNSPEAHAAFIKSEIEKWKKVAAAAGIQPE